MKKIMLVAMIASSAVFARKLVVTPVLGVNYSYMNATKVNDAVLGTKNYDFDSTFTDEKKIPTEDNFKNLYKVREEAVYHKILNDFSSVKFNDSAKLTEAQVEELKAVLDDYSVDSSAITTDTKVADAFTFSDDHNTLTGIAALPNTSFELPTTNTDKFTSKPLVKMLNSFGIEATNDSTLTSIKDQIAKLLVQPVSVTGNDKGAIHSLAAKLGVELKTPVYDQEKVRVLVGGSLLANTVFTGEKALNTYGSIILSPVVEVEYKLNDDVKLFGNVQPGLGVGLFKVDKVNANFAAQLDGTLGAKYDSFRFGVNFGSRFIKGQKALVVNPYVGLSVGYDFSFDLNK